MKKVFSFILAAILALAAYAQNTQNAPESSTFGLDEKDAAAVREIRYKMAQIRKTRPTVALVLSGGGAKGAATVGVLKFMEQYDLPIDMVVGTSIGGLVGAIYALGYDASYLEDLFKEMDWSVALSDKVDKKYIPYSRLRYKEKYLLSFPFYYKSEDYKNFLQGDMPFAAGRSRQIHLGAESESESDSRGDLSSIARGNIMGSLPSGFVFGQNVNNIITSRTVGYSDSTSFFKLPIPFACVATDMVTGKAKIWHNGSINQAMRSTMSIPGLFAPVRTDGMVLVDGGMRNNFPVNIARQMGADIVIGIDLSTGGTSSSDDVQNLGDIMMATMNLFDDDAFNMNVKNVDLHVHPDLTGYNMLSFNRTAVDTMFIRGYKAAEAMKPQFDALRKRLGKAGRHLNGKPATDIGQQPVVIEGIDIVGVDEKEAEYLLSKMSVKPGMIVNREVIENDISVIFGKGAYDYVTYELRGKQDPYRLRVLCKRGPMHQIGFGARIDTQDIVSLLLNVGFYTNAMRGSSVDITTRISLNPYLDVHYAYNAPNFATFNVRASGKYLSRSELLTLNGERFDYRLLDATQEIYLSNMHWSLMDIQLGIKNTFAKVYDKLGPDDLGVNYYVEEDSQDYLGVFLDGRVETMDHGYFPTKGISAGLRLEANADALYKGQGGRPWILSVTADGKFPFSFGSFTFIPQFNTRFVFGPSVPLLYANTMGGDMPGRYLDQQLPFIGMNDALLVRDHVMLARLDARYKIYKNHYVALMGNVAYNFDGFDQSFLNGQFISGAGLGYAYNSIAGPLKLTVHWSSFTKKVGLYISMGYNF